MTAEPTAWAIYGRKTGSLRYAVADADEARDLAEHYNVVPLYPAPTPPAEDVREALIVTIAQRDRVADHIWDQMVGVARSTVREVMADAFVVAGITVTAEVRPRGTVTAEERESEMRELHHFEVEQQLAETIAIVKRAQAAVLRHEHTPASLHMDAILDEVNTEIPSGAEVRPRGTVTDAAALAKAWDEGFTLATRNNPNQPHPLAQSNPYRGEARS